LSGATDALDRRDAVDMAAAAAIMVGLTFSWGLNYVAAKISYAGYDSAIFLNEPLTIRIFLALDLIAAGLIIVNRPARKFVPV
jgi:hypothetical protein